MVICKDCGKEEAVVNGRCDRCENTWQVMYEFCNRPEYQFKKKKKLDDGPARCKVCGKEFIIGGVSPMITITPACKCKRVRSSVRAEGCPECGEAKIGLTLASMDTRIVDFAISVCYIAKCHSCGNTWKVPL